MSIQAVQGNRDVGGGAHPTPHPAFNPAPGYRPCADPRFDPRWWYWPNETGITPHDAQRAKILCATCHIREACAEWALRTREQHLIWGGLDPDERRQILGSAGRRRANSHTETRHR